MRRWLPVLLAAALALLVGAPLSQAEPDAAQLTRLNIAHSTISAQYAPIWVADAAGAYRRYGLDVDIRNAGAGPLTMAALASGDIQVAYTAGPPTVNAILAGGDVRVFSGYLDRMPYEVVARPDIRTIADLRGQTIGINRFGGAAEFVLEYLLQQNGMDVQHDVTLLQIGEQAERVAALRSGGVAATLVNPPFQTVARQYGLQVIFNTATLPVAYSQTVMVAQRPFLDQNSATVQAVLQGTMDGLRLFKQDREMATRVLGERLRIDDPVILTATWEYYRDAFSDDLVPRGLGVILDAALSDHPERAGMRVDDLMDIRALRDLQSQGRLP